MAACAMSLRSFSGASRSNDVAVIVEDLARDAADVVPAFGLYACTVDVDLRALHAALQRRFPKTTLLATTSCQQVASDRGISTAAALFVGGDFAVGAASGSGADHVALGERLAREAIARGKVGATRFVVVHATPGTEEGVLKGLGKVIDDAVIVIGGSGADNDLTGKWQIAGPDGAFADGAAILACEWPWKIGVSYQGGYLATEHEGRITRAEGRRIIAIDDRPAVEVYEGWMGKTLPRNTSILSLTTMTPFGVAYGVGGGLDVHVLVHPERVHDDGSISCFASVQSGERILMMEASTSSLVRRGGLVNRFALQQAGLAAKDIVASFIIYCAGCSLALGDQVGPMTDGVKGVLVDVPFLMPFTFGEQGRLRRARIDHGNLMLSTLLLSNVPR